MRLWSCAVLLFLASLVGAQDLSKPITYRTVAVPLHVALDEISKQAGVVLFASQELQDEPIILSLHATKTKDMMDRLASAIGAEWQQRSDKEFLLTRTDAISAKLTNDAIAQQQQDLTSALSRLQSPKDDPDMSDLGLQKTAQALASAIKIVEDDPVTKKGMVDGRQVQAISVRCPAQHALVNLIRLLPVNELAKLEPGERVIYSNQPNAMQQELPDEGQGIVEEFITEQNKLAADFKRVRAAPVPYFSGYVAPVSESKERIILIIERPSYWPASHYATLIAQSPRSEGSENLGTVSQTIYLEAADADAKVQKATEDAAKQSEIPLSPESKEVVDACTGAYKHWGAQPLTPAQSALILDPVAHDPLSFLVSDGFFAVADDQEANLIAYPTDSLSQLNYSFLRDQKFKLANFLLKLPGRGMNVTTADGWVIANPIDPVEEWKRRMNRELLGNCLKEAVTSGYISLDSAGALALSERGDFDSLVPEFYKEFSTKFDPYMDRDRHLLRFYGSLTDAQISRLSSGEKIPVGDLTKPQWDELNHLVYGSNDYGRGLEFTAPDWNQGADEGSRKLFYEATEFLPNGLTTSGTISMQSEKKDLLFADWKADDMEFPGETTIDSVGYFVAQKEAGQLKSNVGNPEGFYNTNGLGWIAPGQSRELSFQFDFGNSRTGKGTLREVYQGPERWTLDTLPDDLKQKLKDAVAKAKQQMAEFPQSTPPPDTQPPA